MQKVKLLTIAVIGLLLLNVCLLVFVFFRHPMGMHPHRPKPDVVIIDKLQFDKPQQEAYRLLINEHHAAIIKMQATTRQLKNTLYKQLLLPTNRRTTVDSLTTAIAINQQSIEQINFKHFDDIKQLCKPEQLNNFTDLVDDLAKLFSPQPPPEK